MNLAGPKYPESWRYNEEGQEPPEPDDDDVIIDGYPVEVLQKRMGE